MPISSTDALGGARSALKAAGFFLLFVALVTLVGLGLKMANQPLGETASLWLSAGLGAMVSWILVRMEGHSFSSLGFRWNSRWMAECLLGALGGLLLIVLTALLVRGAGGFHWERSADVGGRQLLLATWMFLAVGFNEEILFRGYPFQRLVAGAGIWIGQGVFAVLFAVVHGNNPGMQGTTKVWATLNIGLAAILLGFCYLRTRSLALPIGVHLGWNWAQGALLGFGVSGTTDAKGLWTPVFHGKPEWLTGGAFGLEASLPCTLVCLGVIFLLWRWKGTVATGDASTASAS